MSAVLDANAGVEVASHAVQAALAAGADEAQVTHVFDDMFEITYDKVDVGMIRTTVDDQISLTVYVNGAKGQSSLTGRSHDLIDQAAAEAVAAARAGVSDDANGIIDEPSTGLVEFGDREPQQEVMLDAITRFQEYVTDTYPLLMMRDSTYSFSNRWRAFANSAGLTRQERNGRYSATAIFSGKDGEKGTSFNFTGAAASQPFADIADMATIRQLMQDTMQSFDPQPVPSTFVGDIIFTPDSFITLINSVIQSLSGYTLMKGTSPFQDSLGQAIADSRLSVTSRALSDAFPTSASFDGEGSLVADLPVITNGVLTNYAIDLYTSRKLNRPMTGSVVAIDVPPGDQSYDDLIANTERGIVLGRFSGGMPNQQLDFSGVAKNSFYVEDGKVQFPISETMIAGNFTQLLNAVRGIGDRSVNFGGTAFPALAASGVTISTK